MLRHSFKKSEIIAPQHASRAENVFRLLDEIAGNLDSLNDVISGSLLGGFWANFLKEGAIWPTRKNSLPMDKSS